MGIHQKPVPTLTLGEELLQKAWQDLLVDRMQNLILLAKRQGFVIHITNLNGTIVVVDADNFHFFPKD